MISKPIDSINKYTIDHNHERINFLVNDELVRTYRRIQDSESPIQHKLFYPDRPMKVQFALWSDPDNEWAGGAIKWPNGIENVTAEFRNLEIECYDDQDQIVPKWPLLFNPDYTKEIELQPIRLKEGSIPVEAGPGFQGAIPFISKNELETIDPIATTNYTKKPEFKLHLPFASSSGSFSTFKFVPFTLLLTSFVSCL